MAKANESWYDRQALISKLITYAAILIFVGCFGWGVYLVYKDSSVMEMPVVFGIMGLAVPAFLVGVSAIIDLLIVNAEALRAGKR